MKAERNRNPTLEEVWAIRRRIAERFGHDPKKQVAYYQRKQKQLDAMIYRRQDQLAPAK